ncbi:hypothetical protein HMPREF9088_1516 [Enterococcus italicus DSM 15952]|uniref:Uncharacterized protein n=1 Tax=Enterococcus italicus (strain DSM 15952 / CCUG 50447 / LMG 22039 / TP 1.5) TaxID=888064 RepID=E6LGM6_ENTI1|nr:hypothetical protein HMPREF9088_1516 [Enterococcus italicus DSM 15952]
MDSLLYDKQSLCVLLYTVHLDSQIKKGIVGKILTLPLQNRIGIPKADHSALCLKLSKI